MALRPWHTCFFHKRNVVRQRVISASEVEYAQERMISISAHNSLQKSCVCWHVNATEVKDTHTRAHTHKHTHIHTHTHTHTHKQTHTHTHKHTHIQIHTHAHTHTHTHTYIHTHMHKKVRLKFKSHGRSKHCLGDWIWKLWPEPYLCTVYDQIFGGYSAKNSVHTHTVHPHTPTYTHWYTI